MIYNFYVSCFFVKEIWIVLKKVTSLFYASLSRFALPSFLNDIYPKIAPFNQKVNSNQKQGLPPADLKEITPKPRASLNLIQ